MTLHKYILDERGKPVIETDINRWAQFFESDRRSVARTKITHNVTVSTIFLALDHNFSMEGDPVLWETMIFGGKHNQEMWRYRSREEAEAGHKAAVKLAKEAS